MIAAYLRCSSPARLKRQDTASQRASISRYAKAHGLKIASWLEDYATGRNIQRPALQALLKACRNGEVTEILATDLSRISRSVKDAVELVKELHARNVRLILVNQGFTFEPSALNVAMLQIMAVLAELDSSIKSERIKNGLQLARERGVRLGAKPDLKKRHKATILRESGLTYKQIGQQLHTTPQNAFYLVSKGIKAKKAVS